MDITASAKETQKYVEVFCCYARDDQKLLQELKKHLRPLEREGLITLWADTDINAGAEWEKEIHLHLNTSHIILLLISPDFIASDYCYSIEMTRAMERHEKGEAQVIPIILRPVDWQGAPFSKIQALPKDAKPIQSNEWHSSDEAFLNVAEGIRKIVEKERTKASANFSPAKSEQFSEIAERGDVQDSKKSSSKIIPMSRPAENGDIATTPFLSDLNVEATETFQARNIVPAQEEQEGNEEYPQHNHEISNGNSQRTRVRGWILISSFVGIFLIDLLFNFYRFEVWLTVIVFLLTSLGLLCSLPLVYPRLINKFLPNLLPWRKLLTICSIFVLSIILILNMYLFYPEPELIFISPPQLSPSQLVLDQFCQDLENHEYQDAYRLQANFIQKSNSFEQFKTSWTDLQITKCTPKTLTESTPDIIISNITYYRVNFPSITTEMVVDDTEVRGSWKISSLGIYDNPQQVLNQFCEYTVDGRYQNVYYGMLTSFVRNSNSFEQFKTLWTDLHPIRCIPGTVTIVTSDIFIGTITYYRQDNPVPAYIKVTIDNKDTPGSWKDIWKISNWAAS